MAKHTDLFAAFLFIIIIMMNFSTGCAPATYGSNTSVLSVATKSSHVLLNEEGQTLMTRIQTPEGFERISAHANSYAAYLRNTPVKAHDSPIRLYDGTPLSKKVHTAVLDVDVGRRDLQQCADAVIRLRAEYLYSLSMVHKIHFNFTNGFLAEYSRWVQGDRIIVEGNEAWWTRSAAYTDTYTSFREYLDMVFMYAGTLSLSAEMEKISMDRMQIGDVFLKGETPGHCVLVIDMAWNPETGKQLFLLAQSYMPAQDIHVLKNPNSADLSPWYEIPATGDLATPEWTFNSGQLYRFRE